MDDLDYAAVPGGYSVRELILHIAQEEYGEIHYGITGKLDAFPPTYHQDEYQTIESLLGLIASVHAETMSSLEGISDEDLAGEVEAGWGGVYPLINLIWHVMEHEIHHRGELSLILGLLGREGIDA